MTEVDESCIIKIGKESFCEDTIPKPDLGICLKIDDDSGSATSGLMLSILQVLRA